MKLVEVISEAQLRQPISRWTGNDASNRHHTGVLNPSDTRDFVLHWKRSPKHQPVFIGCFRLWMENLVSKQQCVRKQDKIRVTLYHDEDGVIRMRIRRGDKGGLEIGKVGSEQGRM